MTASSSSKQQQQATAVVHATALKALSRIAASCAAGDSARTPPGGSHIVGEVVSQKPLAILTDCKMAGVGLLHWVSLLMR
jgi:hypothetical protein